MNRKATNILISLCMAIFLLPSFQAIAQVSEVQNDKSITYIKMSVDGLACPFCAYGLEKKIKKIKGSKDMFIEINEGYVTFNVSAANKPTEEELLKLVKEAGFAARDITYSEEPFSNEE